MAHNLVTERFLSTPLALPAVAAHAFTVQVTVFLSTVRAHVEIHISAYFHSCDTVLARTTLCSTSSILIFANDRVAAPR